MTARNASEIQRVEWVEKAPAVRCIILGRDIVCRLQSTFLGSRALAGTFFRHGMLASVDKKGATLSDILRADGYGLGGASEQAIEQAVEGLALDASAVQG